MNEEKDIKDCPECERWLWIIIISIVIITVCLWKLFT